MTKQANNQSLISLTNVIQLTLTLKMTTAQVVEMSVTVNNSPIQDYVHPDDQTQPTFEMTPWFKPFTSLNKLLNARVFIAPENGWLEVLALVALFLLRTGTCDAKNS